MLNIHIYPSSLTHESRIIKISRSLLDGGVFSEIEVIGTADEALADREKLRQGLTFVRLQAGVTGMRGGFGRVLKMARWLPRVFGYVWQRDVACINAHSLSVLPICVLLSALKKCVLIYDPHELETEVMGSVGWARPILKATEWVFIRAANAVSVVNPEIGEWYENHYEIPRPWVVQNVPDPRVGNTGGVERIDLRKTFNVPPDASLFLYQGLLSPGRGLQQIIEAFTAQDRHHVVFMGYGIMEDDIRSAGTRCDRIHFHPAVPASEVLGVTKSADIGLALIEAKCLSYKLSLPNKVFEYIECGLPVVASDFPVLSRVIRELEAGWLVAPEAEALSTLLSSLTAEELKDVKTRMSRHRELYSWKNEERELLKMYACLGFRVDW